MESKETLAVIKLSRNTYARWKREAKWFMIGKGLWGHIDGTEKKAKDGEKGLDQWTKDDALAMYYITRTLDDELEEMTRTCETAKASRNL